MKRALKQLTTPKWYVIIKAQVEMRDVIFVGGRKCARSYHKGRFSKYLTGIHEVGLQLLHSQALLSTYIIA